MLEEYVPELSINQDAVNLVNKHKEDIESRLKMNFTGYQIIGINTSVLAGINHEILIRNDKGRILKVHIYESLPHNRYHTNLCGATLINYL